MIRPIVNTSTILIVSVGVNKSTSIIMEIKINDQVVYMRKISR